MNTTQLIVKTNDDNFSQSSLLQFEGFVGKPFYFVKEGYKGNKDNAILSVCTMCDLNRIHLARQIAINFNGPVSISLYFEEKQEINFNEIYKHFEDINNSYDIIIGVLWPNKSSSEYISLQFDHTATFSDRLPRNAMRNLAAYQVKTIYTLHLDVDFIYMSNTINLININKSNHHFLVNDKTVWIIPSFEFIKPYQNDNNYLMDKLMLKSLQFKKKILLPFHSDLWSPAQRCTRYRKWHRKNKDYSIDYCHSWYEPWIIIKTKYIQNEYKWDNSYVGRGANKVEHISRLANDCFKFRVIHDMFIIHLYSESKKRGKMNKTKITKYQDRMSKKYIKQQKKLCKSPNSCLVQDNYLNICRFVNKK